MLSNPSEGDLANYRLLLNRIDNLCSRITEDFAQEISCKAGCSGCCRHLTLFAVEAANLLAAVKKLPDETRTKLIAHKEWPESSPCPLLINNLCSVYPSRPVICRTHGLPLLLERDGATAVDYCPENFTGRESLPGTAVLNLETVNSTLFAINSIFVAETDCARLKSSERFTIADIIRLSEETP